MALPLVGVAPTAARAALGSLVDYAGLFPPASRGIEDAARRYARLRRGEHAWMLGSFVVPAARLVDLERALPAADPDPDSPWSLSVLVGEPVEEGLGVVAEGRERLGERAMVAALEVAPLAAPRIGALADRLPDDLPTFFEVPLDDELAQRLRAVAGSGRFAKVRTGGVAETAIPSPEQVARFLVECRGLGVPFKATAGLHHAVRARHPLTYEPDSPRATMHGFLNLLIAALRVSDAGGPPSEAEAAEILSDEDADAFRWSRRGIGWRDRDWSLDQVQQVRRGFFLSFGSCSFSEPVAELLALGVLEAEAD